MLEATHGRHDPGERTEAAALEIFGNELKSEGRPVWRAVVYLVEEHREPNVQNRGEKYA